MRKVDWQKHSLHRKPTVIATPSLDTLSITGLPSSTWPDWRGRVQGKEHASFGQAVHTTVSYRRQSTKWILQIFYANSHWYMWRPKGERERGEEKGMTARIWEKEKPRKTGNSIFSKAQHPAAQTSSSFQKKDGVFVKYTSFSTQENVALIDGRCAVQWLFSVR